MKSWSDLSWREKCEIRDGEARVYKYISGYTFDVKTKVSKGIKEKQVKETNNGT